jgi:O-antigen ligase/tetratricopeptide (TPR) repeat protein
MTRRTARRARTASNPLPSNTWQRSRLRLVGVALVSLKVALLPLVFDPSADIPFTVAKALFSHALAYAVAGVLLGLLIEFGRAFVVWSWIHVPVLGFLVANIIATVFAANIGFALYGAHVRMLGLGTLVDCVVLYFAIVLLVRTRNEATAVIVSGLAGSGAVLVYELVQLLGRDPGVWNVDPSVRPFSTLGQTTTLAEYLTVVATGAAALGIFVPRLRLPLRAGLLALSALLLGGVVVTQTRSALLGAIGGALVLLALMWAGHPNRRARVISVAGAAGAAAVIGLVLAATPLGARVLSTVEAPDVVAADDGSGARLEESAGVRLALYRIAFDMVRERPFVGYGPDNIGAGVPTYRTAHEPTGVQQSVATSAHSWLAQVAATTGVLGLAAYLAIVIIAVAVVARSRFPLASWPFLAMLAAFLGAGLTTINDIGTEWLFWACLAGIAIVTATPSMQTATSAPAVERTTRAVPRPRSLQLGVATLCVLVGLVLVPTVWSALDASRASKHALQLRLGGQYAQAIDSSLHATGADPGRPEYWEGLGLGYVGAQRFGDAAAAFERASALVPYDVRYLGEVARAYAVLAQRGDATAGKRAREVAERGVQIDRNNPQAHLTRAIVMQVNGDLAEALKSVERALALDSSFTNAQLDLTAIQILSANGQTADAITTAHRSIGTLNPNDTVQIRVELARALVAAKQPAQALAELDAALAIKPNDAAALQLRAMIRAGNTQ